MFVLARLLLRSSFGSLSLHRLVFLAERVFTVKRWRTPPDVEKELPGTEMEVFDVADASLRDRCHVYYCFCILLHLVSNAV